MSSTESTESAEPKKRAPSGAGAGAGDAKKSKVESANMAKPDADLPPKPDADLPPKPDTDLPPKPDTDLPPKQDAITLQKDSVGVRIAGTAGALYSRGLGSLDVTDDPQGQFLVMITSNTEKAERRRIDKGGDSYVMNCVIIRALKAGFSTSPYEVSVYI